MKKKEIERQAQIKMYDRLWEASEGVKGLTDEGRILRLLIELNTIREELIAGSVKSQSEKV